ncbi:MAG: chitobiase/beta-hexosaminidase C-terminal domain-containing protein [Spirochaetia bacterium]
MRKLPIWLVLPCILLAGCGDMDLRNILADTVERAKGDIVATPTFTPGAGICVSGQTVTISTTTAEASIRYTIDGSTPTDTIGALYTAPINVANETIKAIAYESGWADSSVSSAAYILGHIYISGTTGTSQNFQTPCYWRDGTLTPLQMGSGNTVGQAVNAAVDSSGNLYIAGCAGPTTSSWGYNTLPCYWENETLTLLSIVGNTYGQAAGVAIDSSGNLYVAGCIWGIAGGEPCYWKNGTQFILSMGSGNTFGYANSVALDNAGNVYIVGKVGPAYNSAMPCYWENGTLTLLPMGSGNTVGYASTIALDSAGNVYIAG